MQAKYFNPKMTVKNGDELIQTYDGFMSGFLKSSTVMIYNNTVSDTSINGTMGKWVHSVYSKNNGFEELYTYVVLANSHFYVVTFGSQHPIFRASNRYLSKFFASLHFPDNMKESSGYFPLEAKSYRFGQRLGFLLPYLLGAGLLIIILIILIRRRIHR
jgi:hypothetical protein